MTGQGDIMDIPGIDISKATFDVALLIGVRTRHATFSNTKAGFVQLLAWLAKYRPDPDASLHACMEATSNYGLDLADFLHGRDVCVSIVNPARVKAFGASELTRNKTDKLDAALTARFCRAHVRLPGRRRLAIYASCVNWFAAATRSSPPASRNSTARRPASCRPPWLLPSLPTSNGLIARSTPSRQKFAS